MGMGLSDLQLDVITAIPRDQELTPSEIVTLLGRHAGSVYTALGGLVKKGHLDVIEPQPGTRAQRKYRLTDDPGVEEARRDWKQMMERREAILARWSP
jgi:DNA-binding PadR family transcriptional regulator